MAKRYPFLLLLLLLEGGSAALCSSWEGEEKKINILQGEREQQHVLSALETAKKDSKEPTPVDSKNDERLLHTINAILYTSDTSWSVWVGTNVFDQNHQDMGNHLFIRALNSRTVEIKTKNHKKILFVGQCYDYQKEIVVSGERS